MEDSKIVICRLCLNFTTFDECQVLDAVSRDMLKFIVPEVDLDISQDPKICQTCYKTVLRCYRFKSNCNKDINTGIKKNSEEESDSISIEIDDVENKCNFCLNNRDDEDVEEFNDRKTYFTEVLQKCLSEWNLSSKMIPCKKCLDVLTSQFTFIGNCVDTEDKLKHYRLTHGTNSKGKLNLYEAVQHILSKESRDLDVIIKADQEIPFPELVVNTDTLKMEEVDIKSEGMDDGVLVSLRKMSGEKKWNTENTCKLIELYREHSLLWDPKHKDYKNRFKKADALKDICLALNINSVDDVEKKIRNINSQYTRERRTYKKMKKSGAGKHFTSKWFGYELLSFLRDKNKPRKSLQAGFSRETHESDSSQSSVDETEPDDTGNIPSDSQQTIDIETIENMDIEHTVVTDVKLTSSMAAKEKSQETSEKAKINKAVKRKDISQNVERRNEEVYNIVTSLHKDRHEKSQNKPDKFDIIGELVAQKLRGLPTPYAQSTVEHLIHNLLYDAEMGKYNSEPNKPPSSQGQNQLQQFLRFPTTSSAGFSHLNPLSVDTQHLYSNPPNANTLHLYPNPPNANTQHSCPNPLNANTQRLFSNPPSVDQEKEEN